MAKIEAGNKEALIEELLAKLARRPKIHSDAVKWTFARWSGISFSSLFEDIKSEEERDNMLGKLRNDNFYRVINDPNRGSEVIIQVTEKGRDAIIGLFYSKSEQRELKRLFKKFDLAFAPETAPQTKT